MAEHKVVKWMAELQADQISAIKLQIAGEKQIDIADQLDRARSTIWRWNKDPQYQAVLKALKTERSGQFVSLLQRIYTNDVLAKYLEEKLHEYSDEEVIDKLSELE